MSDSQSAREETLPGFRNNYENHAFK